MNKRGGRERKLLWHHKCRGHHGSQLLRSALSKERLLVFRGDMGLGGLLRLELLEAVECLGESESCKIQETVMRNRGEGRAQLIMGPRWPHAHET